VSLLRAHHYEIGGLEGHRPYRGLEQVQEVDAVQRNQVEDQELSTEQAYDDVSVVIRTVGEGGNAVFYSQNFNNVWFLGLQVYFGNEGPHLSIVNAFTSDYDLLEHS